MMLLLLDALPPQTTRGTIHRLLMQVGGIDRQKIGGIEVKGRSALVQVPEPWGPRLVKSLDGARLGNQNIRASLRSDPGASDAAADFPKVGPEDHFTRLTRLLDMEGDAAAKQAAAMARRFQGSEAERTGTSLVDLVMRDSRAGLGGRVLAVFAKRTHRANLPWTRLDTGSPVVLSRQDGTDDSWRGVVSRREAGTIEVAFSTWPDADDDGTLFRIDASTDEIARERQKQAMKRAASATGDRLAQMRKVLLGEKEATFRATPEWRPLDTSLNDSQKEAVAHALSAYDVAILHGPPGTGKTRTVVELIRQSVLRGQKVIACAPSNSAVDTLFERLLAAGEKAVRLGHPARVLPALREHTLDLMVENHRDVQVARKLVREAYALREKAAKQRRTRMSREERREMRAEASDLIAEARRIEAVVVEHILDSATVLCATLTGVDSELIGKRRFDLAVIDEACQCTEPACWIPLLRTEKVVLAGDHCQLPPTIVSAEAAAEGFGVSLLERLADSSGDQLLKRLDVQYRMHEAIMEFSSREFYESTLLADDSVAHHLLCELEGVATNDMTSSPLLFIDTAGARCEEEQEPDGESRRNPQEATLVVDFVKQLLEAGLDPKQLAVIAPYSAQVRLLRSRLDVVGLEIDSVDGFQGREKEAVIISLVRSNPKQEIGFLSDVRRMNVALTRARRRLIVVADSATIGSNPFYGRLLEHFEKAGAYRTAWEFL